MKAIFLCIVISAVGCSDAKSNLGAELSGSKGDEVHFATAGGDDVDATTFMAADVANSKSWARLPDGTGTFQTATPTRGSTNMM